jgi:hypothetical protein
MTMMDPMSHVRIVPAWIRLPDDHKKIVFQSSRRKISSYTRLQPTDSYTALFLQMCTSSFTYAVKIIIKWHQTLKVFQPWSNHPAPTISPVTEHHKQGRSYVFWGPGWNQNWRSHWTYMSKKKLPLNTYIHAKVTCSLVKPKVYQ